MAKRIKRVFSNGNQVLHLWANQSQSDARSSNVFFEGVNAYSYGYHFKLGRIYEINGTKLVILTSRSYSQTTNKHKNWSWHATSHMVQLKSSNVDCIETALRETQNELVSSLMGHFTSLTFYRHYSGSYKCYYNQYFKEQVDTFNNTCDLLKQPKMKLVIEQDFIDLINAHVKSRLLRQQILDSEFDVREQKRQLERAKQAKVDRDAWLIGGPLTSNLRILDPQLIRINGNIVETTRGAEVPLTEAKVLLVKLLNNHAKTGDKIGSFEFNKVENNIVKIGCHNIDFNQAKELFKKAS